MTSSFSREDLAALKGLLVEVSPLVDRYIEALKEHPTSGTATGAIITAATLVINDVATDAAQRVKALDISTHDKALAVCQIAEQMALAAGFRLASAPMLLKIAAAGNLKHAVELGLATHIPKATGP